MKTAIVTGGRNFADAAQVRGALGPFEPDLVIHGGAAGLDSLVSAWAKRAQVNEFSFPAKWAKKGTAAGPIRNSEMVKFACTHREWLGEIVCFSFPGASGTADMTEKCERAGIRTVRVGRIP